MKRPIFLLVAVAVLVLSFSAVQSPAKAATSPSSPVATVLAFRLRVRDAGSLKGKILEMVKFGNTLTILGRNSQMTWLKIQAPDGTTGWVSALWVRLQRTTILKNLPVVL